MKKSKIKKAINPEFLKYLLKFLQIFSGKYNHKINIEKRLEFILYWIDNNLSK